MAKLLMAVGVMVVLVLVSSPAMSVPFPTNVATDAYDSSPDAVPTANDNDDGIPDIFQAVNQILGTGYATNQDVDFLFVEPDYVWTEPIGQTSAVALIGLTADFSNTFGYYTDTGISGGSVRTPLIGPTSGHGFAGAGTPGDPYPGAILNIDTDFGWYLYADQTTLYFSEPGLNPDELDHMMTFSLSAAIGNTIYINFGSGAEPWELSNPFLVCWEDLPLVGGVLGDEDYDDMMYLVDVRPADVPEPATLFLLGSGLIGLAMLGRRRFSQK